MPYDPTYAYEVATIVQDGVRRMLGEQEDVYYYITLLNENYQHPAMPAGAEDGILRGMYLLRDGGRQKSGQPRVQLMGSGSILREVLAAADLLRDDWGVVADVWSATSFTLLHRDGEAAARWNLLHPTETPRRPYVAEQLDGHDGPVIAATDYVKTFAEQIRPFVGDRKFHALGTDGFGRSDTRKQLREFFEVDRRWVALAALKALSTDKSTGIDASKVASSDREIRYRPEQTRTDDGVAAMAQVDLTVPDLGGFNDIPVIEVLVKPGDTVAKETPLVTLESDKATMEVPASSGGVVKDMRVKIGDKVSQGTVLVTVESADVVPHRDRRRTSWESPPPTRERPRKSRRRRLRRF